MKLVIVDGPVNAGKARKAKYRMASRDGRSVRLRVVDADSPSFGADFLDSFKANVRHARQENRALVSKA